MAKHNRLRWNLCILFWALCWGLGAAKGGFDIFVHEPNRVVQVNSNPDGLFALSNNGAIRMWNSSKSDWDDIVQPAFNGPGPMISQPRSVLPAYDVTNGYSLFVRDRNQLCKLNKEDLSQSEVYDSLPSSIKRVVREADGQNTHGGRRSLSDFGRHSKARRC